MRVGGSISLSKQTDLGIPQWVVISVTLFLMAINGILGELEIGVDKSLFVDEHCKVLPISYTHGQWIEDRFAAECMR